MKNTITYSLILLSILISCEQIPDLNPLTNAGADISVFEINEIIQGEGWNGTPGILYKSYDLDNDGNSEIEVSSDRLTVRGELLFFDLNPANLPDKKLATRNNTNSGNLQLGEYYADQIGYLSQTYGVPYPLMTTTTQLPRGNKYIMIKLEIDGAFHYGWIEYTSTMFTQNYTLMGSMTLNRVGIANQPGLVLRAGQTE